MAAAQRRSQAPRDPSAALRDLRDRVARLHLETMQSVIPARAEQTARQWAARLSPDLGDAAANAAMTEAIILAVDVETFTPSLKGTTALDRVARQRGLDRARDPAFEALKRARFVPFMLHAREDDDHWQAENLVTRQRLTLFDDQIPGSAAGIPLVGRIFPLDGQIFGYVGMVTPLDGAALSVAMEFVRPGRGIVSDHRCAAAVYRHVVRHGGPMIPGLNDIPTDDPGDDQIELTPFDVIAAGLVASDDWRNPPAAVLDDVRRLTSIDAVLDCLFKAVAAARADKVDVGIIYRRFAEVMIEALHLRALAGSGVQRAPLEALKAIIDGEVASNGYPGAAAEMFRDICRALTTTKPRQHGADLARVIERIRALRAKTTDQGCTEEEALAAADKVAELLDRYGLSLGETDLRHQACLGVGIDSARKRFGPLEDCVPEVAQFCDCRSWFERTPDGRIRAMFFGLPADVEAAQYLHERVATAIETETATFQRGVLYGRLVGGGRQKATSSFQLGLSRGIGAKLVARKSERDTKTFKMSGRDLVPVKASVVEEEMAKLGMSFKQQGSARSRLVMPGAYEAGQVASGRFEVQSELENDGSL